MPRRMAFSKTIPQMRAGTKDITRRVGWEWLVAALEVGHDIVLTAIEKGQGLKKGERQVVIRNIQILGARREPLGAITAEDVAREGFPGETPAQFIARFGKPPHFVLTRIVFRHLWGTEP